MLDRKFFTHDVGAKLLSLLAAVLVWSSIEFGMLSGDRRDARETVLAPHTNDLHMVINTRAFSLPIMVLTTAEDLHGFKVVPATVNVTLKGEPGALKNVTAGNIQAFVNLLEIPESANVRREIKLHLPPGLDPLVIDPAEVQVERIDPGTAK